MPGHAQRSIGSSIPCSDVPRLRPDWPWFARNDFTPSGSLITIRLPITINKSIRRFGSEFLVEQLKLTQAALHWAQSLATPFEAFVTSFVVGISNNLLNNLPLGLIAEGTLQADLGPNLSVTGSLAKILWLIALLKEKLDVSFWDFLKVGAVAMPVAMFVSVGGAILMQMFFKPS
jgi:hypothetical protein